MSEFHRGEIWLVNFEPSFGHEYQKVRPALIVQQDTYIPQSSLLTVIPISSQVANRTQLDLLLEKNERNRLRQDSVLKVQQVSSFDKRSFIKLIGRVDPQIMGAMDVKIKQFLFGAEPEIA